MLQLTVINAALDGMVELVGELLLTLPPVSNQGGTLKCKITNLQYCKRLNCQRHRSLIWSIFVTLPVQYLNINKLAVHVTQEQ